MSMNSPVFEEAVLAKNVFRRTIEQDRPLAFHWHTLEPDTIMPLGLRWSEPNRYSLACNSILTEAVLAYPEGHWVSYSRHKAFYSGLSRYHGTAYTYATVLAAIDELKHRDLIEEQRSSPLHRGWQSRFRATPKLVAALADAPLTYDMHEVIRLKDADGKLIDYRDTDATWRMRREMQAINAALASIRLDIPIAPGIIRTPRHLIVDDAYYRPTSPALWRIFNRGSFGKGGRAYGWWQSLPKGWRRQLLINGEPTAEPDFSQMHASILYAERGQVLIGDAYETGEFSRDMGKIAFNVALNARTRQGAISALLNKAGWTLSAKSTGKLLEAVKQRNAPIAADLHADRGITLMRQDSEITLGALKKCIRVGIPALPIHDSMLTTQRQEGRVAEIMEESAAKVLKRSNPCKVSMSRPPVPQTPSPCLPLSFSWSGPVARGGLYGPGMPLQLNLFPDPGVDSFSSQIKQLRNRLGLSQRALAAKIGCQQPHVANVEQGRRHLAGWSRRRLHDLMRRAA